VSKDQKTYELIDSYLKGELKVEEADKVKYRLRNDEEFALQVELQAALIKELKVSREQELRTLLKEQGNVNYISNMWSTPWLRASAAVFLGFLALFIVIKYFMPEESRPLVENQKKSPTEIVEDTTTTEDEELAENANRSDSSATIQSDTSTNNIPELDGLAEEEIDQDIVEKPTEVSEQKDDFTTLRKESDQLEVEDDVEVKTDKLLLSKSVFVLVLDAPVVKTKRLDEISTSETTSSKISRRERKKREKELEEQEKAADKVEGGSDAVAAPLSKKQNIELWEGVVNSQGYMWDKQTLLLYGIKPTEKLLFKQYQNTLYMKRGSKYYSINRSAKFEPYRAVTNTEILKALE